MPGILCTGGISCVLRYRPQLTLLTATGKKTISNYQKFKLTLSSTTKNRKIAKLALKLLHFSFSVPARIANKVRSVF